MAGSHLNKVCGVWGQEFGEEWGHFIRRRSAIQQFVQQRLEHKALALVNQGDLWLAALGPQQTLKPHSSVQAPKTPSKDADPGCYAEPVTCIAQAGFLRICAASLLLRCFWSTQYRAQT